MSVRRFIFENDFDDKTIQLEPVVVHEPTFLEHEITAAKDIAYLEGVNEGRKMQQTEIEAQILQIVSGFDSQLNRFMDSEAEKRQQLQVMSAKLAKTIALKICLTELEKHAVDRVLFCLESATKMLLTRPKMTVNVHPDLATPLSQHLQPLIKEGEIKVLTDDTLMIYDCRFQWQEGGAEIVLQHVLDQIDTYITQLAE